MAKKKTWREKLMDSRDFPKVVSLGKNAREHWKGCTMAIPSPMEVDEIMAGVPHGKLITLREVRQKVASIQEMDIFQGKPVHDSLEYRPHRAAASHQHHAAHRPAR